MKLLLTVGLILSAASYGSACTITTTSGEYAPAPGSFCAGQLIFEDNFDTLDQNKWKHEVSLSGGGNWEFQWYLNDRANSYVTAGNLHLRPTKTADIYGESFLYSGHIVIPPAECTQSIDYGCERTGNPTNILNPIRSARVDTSNSFRFKFGRVQIRAKMPAGDWIWPALWMMPRYAVYGTWPASGEIDIMEARGNRNLMAEGVNVGVEQAGSTMHWGPDFWNNGYMMTHATRNRAAGFHSQFVVYELNWTDRGIQFLYDGELVLDVPVPAGGFWEKGGFAASGLQNPWAWATSMAPFDNEFFIIMNLAVGGTNGFFADNWQNPHPKPWLNTSGRAMLDFWQAQGNWRPTWNEATDDSHMQVDYVRVFAV